MSKGFYERLQEIEAPYREQKEKLLSELEAMEENIKNAREYAEHAVNSGEYSIYQKWSGKAEFAAKRREYIRQQLETLDHAAIEIGDLNELQQEINGEYAAATSEFYTALLEKYAEIRELHKAYRHQAEKCTEKAVALARLASDRIPISTDYGYKPDGWDEFSRAGEALVYKINSRRESIARNQSQGQ